MAYKFKSPPQTADVGELQAYIAEELTAIEAALNETTALELRPVYRAPDKPRAGMIVFADGTRWNPGSGEGVYAYSVAGTWVKLF